MADKSRIAWTEATWNPIRGCSKISNGCVNCYAETMAARFCGEGQPYSGFITDRQWNGKVCMVPEHLDDPLRWRRPRRVFVNSMSDLFHESLSFEDIAAIFGIMGASPHHTFQVLTKRSARMVEWFRWIKEQKTGLITLPTSPQLIAASAAHEVTGLHWTVPSPRLWPLPNVWLGVTVEDQAAADERIPHLLQTPAAVRWISMEPLLGPVDLMVLPRPFPFHCSPYGWPEWLSRKLHWVVVGGESGPRARPMHPNHVRSLRDQCAAANVPFFFKQWGEWAPAMGDLWWHPLGDGPEFRTRATGKDTYAFGDGYGAVRIGKAHAGRLLDGKLHDDYPTLNRDQASV